MGAGQTRGHPLDGERIRGALQSTAEAENPPSPFTVRAVALGGVVALTIAGGAPYANMVIRGSYMALDFSTPGAICLLVFLVAVVNVALRLVRSDWLLSQGELLVVYIMGIVASAIPTMGFSEYLLTIISGAFYYATPENNWGELIHPFIPEWLAPRDAKAIRWFYEGAPNLVEIPLGAWIRPLLSWSVFAAGLYGTMIATAVILRRNGFNTSGLHIHWCRFHWP